MVEDVITTASCVLDTCTVLKDVGVNAFHTVVQLDREQGGRANIEKEGVAVSSVLTLRADGVSCKSREDHQQEGREGR